MCSSPYNGKKESEWSEVTDRLISQHPLDPKEIRDITLLCWGRLWETIIGSGDTSIPITELNVPATVVGYLFEKLFAKELHQRCPDWRGGRTKNEKDLVYEPDDCRSIEIKTSGQLGTKVYGNRSYGQEGDMPERSKKEKSGYYITINFYETTLNLIRFGWIDFNDWVSQVSPTGQMASLNSNVYEYKLEEIPGDYRLEATVEIINGIGEKTAGELANLGIMKLRDLRAYAGDDKLALRFKPMLDSGYED